jgi:hypothetical protein
VGEDATTVPRVSVNLLWRKEKEKEKEEKEMKKVKKVMKKVDGEIHPAKNAW